MFKVIKKIEVSACHHLLLDYDSKCTNWHGHNWNLTIEISGRKLNKNGMLMDFSKIKEIVESNFDHTDLNEIVNFNPTAENLAVWLVGIINSYLKANFMELENEHPEVTKLTIEETKGNMVVWEKDDESECSRSI